MIWGPTDERGVVCLGGGVPSWGDPVTVRDEFFLIPRMTEDQK